MHVALWFLITGKHEVSAFFHCRVSIKIRVICPLQHQRFVPLAFQNYAFGIASVLLDQRYVLSAAARLLRGALRVIHTSFDMGCETLISRSDGLLP